MKAILGIYRYFRQGRSLSGTHRNNNDAFDKSRYWLYRYILDIHTCRDGNDEIFALMYNLHGDEDTEKNKIPVAMQKRHLPASLEFSTTQKRLNEAIRRELIETLI